jgi:two-component system chemotaxis response regulator CheB
VPDQIRILLAHHSADERAALSALLNAAVDLLVVGIAANGARAQDLARRLRPDVIVLHLRMPDMDGYRLTEEIMATTAVPVIVLTPDPPPVDAALRASKSGAVAVVAMPSSGAVKRAKSEAELEYLVRGMSRVRVVTRRKPRAIKAVRPPHVVSMDKRIEIVAIGASTGGPQAITTILQGLPKNLPVPVLVVQHIAAGFQTSLLAWIRRVTPLGASIPERLEQTVPGVVYLAPDGFHMEVDGRGRIVLDSSAPEHAQRPSVCRLFRSVSARYGDRCLGVPLTGMGRDGAGGLKDMRDGGAVTIAQDEATSVVFGMPREAIAQGAASFVLPLLEIAPAIATLVGRERTNSEATT